MTEKEEIRWMMQQEQAEAAMRDCIRIYREGMMNTAMQLKGLYDAYVNVGFSSEQALFLISKSIK